MSRDQKEQFIAGYLAGWRDSARVTDITIEFAKQNPGRTMESLQTLRSVYAVNELKPESILRSLEHFYSDPKNQSASFSQAFSAVK